MSDRQVFDVNALPAHQDVIAQPVPRMTLAEQGDAEVAKIVASKPSSFTVGAHTNGRGVTGTLTVDRKWSNGWGATAYARAWWHDTSVTPGGPASGVSAGIEGHRTF